MIEIRPVLVTVVIACLLGACRASSQRETTELKGLSTTKVWPKSDVSVCFNHAGQDPGLDVSDAERVVREALTASFQPGATGIHFTGFGDCAASPADVQVVWNTGDSNFDGAANFIGRYYIGAHDGPNDPFYKSGRPTVIFYVKSLQLSAGQARAGIGIREVLAELAVHEFGHIAGLNHEHAHPRSTCKMTEETVALGRQVLQDVRLELYQDRGTAYDPRSVMSYCKTEAYVVGTSRDAALSAFGVQQGLSLGDRAILKSMYPGGGGILNGGGGAQSCAPGDWLYEGRCYRCAPGQQFDRPTKSCR